MPRIDLAQVKVRVPLGPSGLLGWLGEGTPLSVASGTQGSSVAVSPPNTPEVIHS